MSGVKARQAWLGRALHKLVDRLCLWVTDGWCSSCGARRVVRPDGMKDCPNTKGCW